MINWTRLGYRAGNVRLQNQKRLVTKPDRLGYKTGQVMLQNRTRLSYKVDKVRVKTINKIRLQTRTDIGYKKSGKVR